MNPRVNIYVALALYSLGFLLLAASWALLLYFPPPIPQDAEALKNWIVGTLGALTGHILTLINPGGKT
jgi:hypothetical protein